MAEKDGRSERDKEKRWEEKDQQLQCSVSDRVKKKRENVRYQTGYNLSGVDIH